MTATWARRAMVAVGLAGAVACGAAAALAPAGQPVTSLVVMGLVFLLAAGYFARRAGEQALPGEDRLAALRRTLPRRAVAVELPGAAGPGACWHCGREGAPPRELHLERMHVAAAFLVGALGTEGVTLRAPLCPEHPPDPNRGPYGLRTYGPLAGGVVFAVGAVVAADAFPRLARTHLRSLMLGALAAGAAVGALLWLFGRAAETFRLRAVDPELGVAVVWFRDRDRAERVRQDLGQA